MIVARHRRQRILWRAARLAGVLAALLFVLAPLYWVAITSIKPADDYLAVPPVW
ncbi:MAG: hypothetical protein JOZ58_01845, partial [Acetobacteraceae bacterium]|nr:hypothetical protein [Acetobacteraceae bacterium]